MSSDTVAGDAGPRASADAPASTADTARRRSGRVVRKPTMFGADASAPAPTSSRRRSGGANKRKRAQRDDDDNEDVGGEERARADQDGDVAMRDGEEEVDEESGGEEESEDEEDEEPDEEEVREKRRRGAGGRRGRGGGATATRGRGTAKGKRGAVGAATTTRKVSGGKPPAAKKTKTNTAGETAATNGDGTVQLALRPAQTRAKKMKKAKPRGDALEGTEEGSLYARVFSGENSLDDVAAQWVVGFEQAESSALAELINFVLKCAGCDLKIDSNDAEDPDACPNKLADLQDEYQAQNVTEYPLIAKGRAATSFKDALVGFFDSLIKSIAASSLLFTNPALIENVHTWVSTMSSAANRPFRHTATVVSLAVVTSLCEVGRGILDSAAKTLQQKEGEQKKGRVNKGRVGALEQKSKQTRERQEQLEDLLKDWFDTVFVHRYRDIDPKIRVECVAALSDWIMIYPDVFFDANHLRYLGWVLSDTVHQTRHEVVTQLKRLYADSDKLVGLKTFTEKFRARMVEMATRDADSAVRAAAVELLDLLRQAGMLEPDDIDSIGRLIFDAEPKVRQAVVGFFAENINDVYESKLEEMGGQEALEDVLGPVVAPEEREPGDDFAFDAPHLEWAKIKCLVEILESYDEANADEDTTSAGGALPSTFERSPGGVGMNYVLIAAGVESRFALAAQALYDHMAEVRDWEMLAGYLLYDHSVAAQNGAAAGDDPEALLKQECCLSEKEEIILLDVLHASVGIALTGPEDAASGDPLATTAHGKRRAAVYHHSKKLSKAQRQEEAEAREVAAARLAPLIPRLLAKFGAVPDAASAVLRLEHLLDLDVFAQLRQGSTVYARLLDDVNKQFLTHGSERVLAEASAALLHAKSNEELNEGIEGRIAALWDDVLDALRKLCRGKDAQEVGKRGSLGETVVQALKHTVARIEHLASISDCTDALEARPPMPAVVTPVTQQQKGRKGRRRAAAAANQPSDGASGSQPTGPAPPCIDLLLVLVARADPSAAAEDDTPPDIASERAALEDALAFHAARAAFFYFLWRVRALQDTASLAAGSSASALAAMDLDALAARRDRFVTLLKDTVGARKGAGGVRVGLAGVLLDLGAGLWGLRGVKGLRGATEAGAEAQEQAERTPERANGQNGDPATVAADKWEEVRGLAGPVLDARAAELLREVLVSTMKGFARRAGRIVEVPIERARGKSKAGRRGGAAAAAEDEDPNAEPVDPDGEPEDSDDADADESEDEEEDDSDEESEESEDEAEAGAEEGDEDDEARATRAERRRQKRLRRTLEAERRLCELAAKIVVALLAGCVEGEGGAAVAPDKDGVAGEKQGRLRALLEANVKHLGANYKEVVAYLDVEGRVDKAERMARARRAKREKKDKEREVEREERARREARSVEVGGDEGEGEEEEQGSEGMADGRREKELDESGEVSREVLKEKGLLVEGEEGEDDEGMGEGEEREEVEAEPETVLGD
ncbi:hypothetical protein BDY21DRAFT_374988 [Lineolata rhizophorae]|uniref:SCD domain-containing protein n=1 Tax=Lineolata rhizophorae TaxID=578093 RepID=A0A6A6NN53_9PEZI|nr:hypothetical protein BDY21DRAFT_374988 [Lineolata rhizophorae]